MQFLRRALAPLLALLILLPAVAGANGPRPEGNPPADPKVPAPPFPPGLTWLNSPPLTLEKLRGKVVLLDFWEYTCINCIRTFPYLKSWNQKYRNLGLVIIGIHTPEFRFARERANVELAIKKFGLDYPHVLDSNMDVWNTWGNRYWPAKYLIDKDGNVRYLHFGEGEYQTTENWIQKLLKEANPQVPLPSLTPFLRGTDRPGAVCYPTTPELYLGFERGGFEGTLANAEGYQPGKVVTYRDPGNWEEGLVYLQGGWKNEAEALVSARNLKDPRDYLGLRYRAIEVNSVMRPELGKPVRVFLYQDGKPVAKKDRGADVQYDGKGRSFMLVDRPRMYNLLKNAEYAYMRTLKVATAEAGLGVYSFTFVSCERTP